MRVRKHLILIMNCLIVRIGLLVNSLMFDLFRAVSGLRMLTIDLLLFHCMCHIMVSVWGISCASIVLLHHVFLLIDGWTISILFDLATAIGPVLSHPSVEVGLLEVFARPFGWALDCSPLTLATRQLRVDLVSILVRLGTVSSIFVCLFGYLYNSLGQVDTYGCVVHLLPIV